MRALLVALAACGSHDAPPSPTSEPAKPTWHLDRAPTVLGGPITWGSAVDVVAMRFCPGDNELVVVDAQGWLRRFDASGTAIGALHVGDAHELDCRADGTVVFVAHGDAMLAGRGGKLDKLAANIEQAVFDRDGGVLAIAGDDVVRLPSHEVIAARPALFERLAYGGALVDEVDRKAFVVRDGKPTELPGGFGALDGVSVAPDGAVAVADEQRAVAWVLSDGVASAKPIELLDATGYHVTAVAATDKRFVAVGAGDEVLLVDRPMMRKRRVQDVCGEHLLLAFAQASDGARFAVACQELGVRVFDEDSARQVGIDMPASSGAALAWSPAGDQLAVRARGGGIFVYARDKLDHTRVVAHDGALWWTGDGLGGTERGKLVTSWDKTEIDVDADVAAATTGAIITARRGFHGDEVELVIGGKVIPVDVPATRDDWIDGAAIDDTHALVWRGPNSREPATELLTIDVAKHTATKQPVSATAIAIAPGGFVAAAPDGTLTVSGKAIGKHAGKVTALAVRGDLVVAGGDDGTLSLWTLAGTPIGTLPGHAGAIRAIAISPDGERVATTASDATRVWDVR